jgi:predicted DNA-binding protein
MSSLPSIGANAKKKRTSVCIPADSYEEIERLSVQKKVSVSWVVREAVEQYLATMRPLFHDVKL